MGKIWGRAVWMAAFVALNLVVLGPASAGEIVGVDGEEDFAKIAGHGFSIVTEGDFFGGAGYPNLVPDELGDPRNSYAWSMAWFDGRLYVGTTRDVLCFQGTDPSACPISEARSGATPRAWSTSASAADGNVSTSRPSSVFRSACSRPSYPGISVTAA